MSIRIRFAGLAAAAILGAVVVSPSASAARPDPGIKNVIPITEVLAFGQKVTAVAVEYSSEVNPRTLDLGELHRFGQPLQLPLQPCRRSH